MYLLKMASRNLFRQVGRNGLSMVSIVMGVFVMIAGAGFANGLDENAIRGFIDQHGHVEVVPPDYPDAGVEHPIDELYTVDADTRTWLDQNTEAWNERVVLSPRLIKGRDAVRVRMLGIGPDDAAFFPQDGWTVRGEPMDTNDHGILVTTGLSSLLDVEPGDVVIVETRTADGALNAMQLVVTGVVHTGEMFFDQFGVVAPRPLVDQLALSEGKTSHLSIRLNRRTDSIAFADEAAGRFGDTAEVRTWQAGTKALVEAGEMRRSMFTMLGLALLAMAAVGIANTVLMAAFERIREIGTMRALGMQKSGVIAMFAIEGMWMGLFGGLLGAALGGWLTWHFNQNGIDMMQLMGAKGQTIDEMPMSAMLYTEFSPPFLVGAVVVAIVMSVLASLYPAVIASRLLPADAVRAN